MLNGRRIILRSYQKDDLPLMFEWRNDLDSLHLWSVRRHLVDLDHFVAEFENDLATDRHIHLMIEKKQNHEIIGMIYSYNAQLVDGHCFVTVFLASDCTKQGYGVEAMALFLGYLFTSFNFHKIYMDIYEYNAFSLSTARKAGFVEEGRFKEHRWYDGKRHDMIRFAIYREQWLKMSDQIRRISGSRDKKVEAKGG